MKYNRKIVTVLVIMCVLFLSIFVYLTWFSLFRADGIKTSNYNRRLWEREDSVLRGTIFDRSGTRLAYSELEDGGQKRVYPYGSLYAHVIGYNTRSYGKTNLELAYNDYLLKTETIAEIIQYGMDGTQMRKGCDLVTTLDHGLMETAKADMKGRSGAVVALNPKTGEVLCLFSNPSFDPNEDALTTNWSDLTLDEDSPFLARATKGLYPPGSTFKIAVAAEAIESGMEDYTVDDGGSVRIDGRIFRNAGGKEYGELTLARGFKFSSNVLFSQLGVELGASRLKNAAERFMITKKIDFDIDTSASAWPYGGNMGKTDLASVGIGQGKLMTTPLNMALVAGTIANGGVMMKPYLVKSAVSPNGVTVYETAPEALATAVPEETAEKVADYMLDCVESGTGTNARIRGVEVCGKTGTAQNEREGKDHAWFVGFAPKDDPQIAVAVIQEYSGGSGGSSCAPVARDIIAEWLR